MSRIFLPFTFLLLYFGVASHCCCYCCCLLHVASQEDMLSVTARCVFSSGARHFFHCLSVYGGNKLLFESIMQSTMTMLACTLTHTLGHQCRPHIHIRQILFPNGKKISWARVHTRSQFSQMPVAADDISINYLSMFFGVIIKNEI